MSDTNGNGTWPTRILAMALITTLFGALATAQYWAFGEVVSQGKEIAALEVRAGECR